MTSRIIKTRPLRATASRTTRSGAAQVRVPRGSATSALALIALLIIGAIALIGPTGILAWSDYQQRLDSSRIKLAELKIERDALANRVELLDPDHVDPDLAGELVRQDLNVARPDELVLPLR